jgi:hypothetical protein
MHSVSQGYLPSDGIAPQTFVRGLQLQVFWARLAVASLPRLGNQVRHIAVKEASSVASRGMGRL